VGGEEREWKKYTRGETRRKELRTGTQGEGRTTIGLLFFSHVAFRTKEEGGNRVARGMKGLVKGSGHAKRSGQTKNEKTNRKYPERTQPVKCVKVIDGLKRTR